MKEYKEGMWNYLHWCSVKWIQQHILDFITACVLMWSEVRYLKSEQVILEIHSKYYSRFANCRD